MCANIRGLETTTALEQINKHKSVSSRISFLTSKKATVAPEVGPDSGGLLARLVISRFQQKASKIGAQRGFCGDVEFVFMNLFS
jgi:hypothetical protein